MKRSYFGTDGIRGVANTSPLDPETLVRLGKAIAKVFLAKRGKHRILIGKDTRLSGYMIETALASGITSMGADVLLVGPIPTPGVAYLTKSMRADAGVMVSASHNPFEDNGIKIFGADGLKLADELESELEELLSSPTLDTLRAEPSAIGKATRISDAVGRYAVFLKGFFPRELTLEGLKLGLDCANGASYVVAPLVFQELGAEVISRGMSPNGRNINAGFGSLYPEVVAKLVLEQNLHCGITLDGDADRCLVVDEKGEVLDGDALLAILAIDMQKEGKLKNNIVVGTIMSNYGLEKYLNENGITLIRSQVGDRYVLEDLMKHDAVLGGEQSGHMIFKDMSTTGDGILTALNLLTVLVKSGKDLSELKKSYIPFPQKLINIPVAQKIPLDSVPRVKKIIADKTEQLGNSGRILVRYSGTESKIRVMVECSNEEQCKKHAAEVAQVIEEELGRI